MSVSSSGHSAEENITLHTKYKHTFNTNLKGSMYFL